MTNAEHEFAVQKDAATHFGALIETMPAFGVEPYLRRAFLNGVLGAIAYHLSKDVGPQEAYSVFQRLADDACAPILVRRA